MEPNKILSANVLDLIFEGRNKDYGAYELRVTYPERIKKSMIVVFIIGTVAFAGAALAGSFKPKKEGRLISKELTIQTIEPPEDKQIPPPQLPRPEPPQTRTIQYTVPVIVDNDQVDPPPTQTDIEDARVDVKTTAGVEDVGIAQAVSDLDKSGVIAPKAEEPEAPFTTVEVQASYNGNWVKFLTQNLDPNVPVENNAPVGTYNIIIQFVVDKDGNVSDITPLTNYGYGMEQEAVRVLKKAKGWKPGIQNGHEVKSYHKQPITFVVEDNN